MPTFYSKSEEIRRTGSNDGMHARLWREFGRIDWVSELPARLWRGVSGVDGEGSG